MRTSFFPDSQELDPSRRSYATAKVHTWDVTRKHPSRPVDPKLSGQDVFHSYLPNESSRLFSIIAGAGLSQT